MPDAISRSRKRRLGPVGNSKPGKPPFVTTVPIFQERFPHGATRVRQMLLLALSGVSILERELVRGGESNGRRRQR